MSRQAGRAPSAADRELAGGMPIAMAALTALFAILAGVAVFAAAAAAPTAAFAPLAEAQEPADAEAKSERPGSTGGGEEAPPAVSDRSRVIVRLDCANVLSRRELTLFANGTLRLKAGRPGEEGMSLAELGPDELESAMVLLAEIDLDETDPATVGPEGEWVERCLLELRLPGEAPVERRFKRFDSLPLALARALAVVDGLAAGIEEPRGGPGDRGPARLPIGYEPEAGDLLRHADGTLYEVIAFTADGEGVELQGVEQPLTLYLPRGRLGEEIVELVGRRERRGP